MPVVANKVCSGAIQSHYPLLSTMQFRDFGRDIVTHSDIVRTLGPIAANKEADLANSGLASQFECSLVRIAMRRNIGLFPTPGRFGQTGGDGLLS